MKRILSLILVLILLLALCACGKIATPSSSHIKKIVPETIKISPADYPLLQEGPPSADQILGDIPRTFTFDEYQWTKTVLSKYTTHGIRAYTTADGMTLYYDNVYGYYNIEKGTMSSDLSVSEDYLFLCYDADGMLEYFRKGNYAFYFDTFEENPPVWAAEVFEEESHYHYNFDTQSQQVDEVQITLLKEIPDGTGEIFFYYYPADQSVSPVSYTFTEKYGNGNAEYDSDGNLIDILYYPDNSSVCYHFDENYNLTDNLSIS